MNRITITGRLTRDPELRQLHSGEQVCNLRLAVDGMQPSNETGYIDVVSFGKPAEAAAAHLTKGWLVAVDGRLQQREHRVAAPGADATYGLYLEGALTVEYIATITLHHAGDAEDADALLDAFVARNADASPVVGEDLSAGTIDVTFSVDADDGYQAFERAHELFATLTAQTAFARPVVGVTVELADAHQTQAA